MGNKKSKDTIVEINFEFSIVVRMRECSFSGIMKAFYKILPEILTDFIMKILFGYAEYVMNQKEKPFGCEKCGNNGEFIRKTH